MEDGEGRKIYVGKLDYGTDEETLKMRFDEIGPVEDGKNNFVFLHNLETFFSWNEFRN